MIKNRIVNGQKATDATYVAHADLVRGMGVVKAAAGKTAFVAEATDAGIFVVDKDNLPSGIECAYTDRPDKAFDAIKEGDKVLMRAFAVGESFYVDQYNADAIVDGTVLGVGTDGKWAKFVDGKKYVSRGTEVVAGATMLAVEVIA